MCINSLSNFRYMFSNSPFLVTILKKYNNSKLGEKQLGRLVL